MNINNISDNLDTGTTTSKLMNFVNPLHRIARATAGVCTAAGCPMRYTLLACLLIAGAALTSTASAVDTIEVQALFKGRVVVLLDGKRRLLKVGETSPEGVTLIRSNSKGAEIEIDGKRRTLALGRRIGSNFAGPREQKIRVVANAQGMYKSSGSINGVPMQFLLDTGATLVSISERDAKRIGLDYKRLGTRASSITASGVSPIWRMQLARVKVGEIELHNVEAAVHTGDFPPIALLGNSFLSRVKMTRTGSAVVLQRNY
jgi:aspartyl protease family protein